MLCHVFKEGSKIHSVLYPVFTTVMIVRNDVLCEFFQRNVSDDDPQLTEYLRKIIVPPAKHVPVKYALNRLLTPQAKEVVELTQYKVVICRFPKR